MKTIFNHILLLISSLVLITACSTKKNTWLSRNYQAMNVRYNVYFNGNESYKEGLANINKNHIEDYSEVLLMYPISYHENASAGSGNMERTIEKSQKAIKRRSIKKKPKKNYRKSKDPKYQAFYNQEEFNVMIDDAWLLMGKALFHKADFLGAAATFTYITKHFSSNIEAVSEAHLWMARSYAEMGWFYEAEDALNKVNKDGFSKKQSTLFAAVNADLLLKQQQYNEAIPYLVIAINGEKNKKQKARFQYILGQLYELNGDNTKANQMFTAVVKSNPPFEMQLNARLKQAETHMGSDKESMLKMLNKMAKDSKNTEYLDQIYVAIANIYKQKGDVPNTIANYKLAIEKSTRNGYEKALALVMLADLYYDRGDYIEAQPYYSEAVVIMNPQSSDWRRVNKLAQTLSELNENTEVVILQDSLQMLSNLPEDKQKVEIQKIIQRVIKEEEEAKKKAEEERLLAERSFGTDMGFNSNTNMLQALGQTGTASFYFYNPQLLAAGKADFQRKWGTRRLEDNWRRQVKTSVAFSDFGDEEDDELADVETDSIKAAEEALNDNKKPEFYIRQLFTTQEQFEESDKEIMTALYNIGYIYNDKIENKAKAIETFEELERRFPSFEKMPEVYFYLYRTYTQQNDKAKADIYRNKLIYQYPNNKYARILSQPDYEEKLAKMVEEQNVMYEQTYDAYLASNFYQVFENYRYMEKNYPASPLMPKFALLNSLSMAKTDTPEIFKESLEELLVKYPDSDVTSIAKDMLALMAQGKESQQGQSHGGLLTLREQEARASGAGTEDDMKFRADVRETHFYVIHVPKYSTIDLNKLQYNIAAYNFSKFLIKDFDIEIRKYDGDSYIIVRNLEGLEEGLWYQSGIMADSYLSNEIRSNDLTEFVISKHNFGLIYSVFTLDEYFDFYRTLLRNKDRLIAEEAEPVGVEVTDSTAVALPAKTDGAIVDNAIRTEQPAITETLTETPQGTTQPVTDQPATPGTTPAETTAPPATTEQVAPKKDLPKFRGMYTYDESAKHYFAFYVLSGEYDIEKLKADIGAYNAENYPLLNMQITEATSGKNRVILIGTLPDAVSAKSYLLRITKNRELFAGLGGASYRNLVITDDNLQVLDKVGNPTVYLDFLREYYLK